MQDRFKFRLIVEKDYKTINGTFKGIQVYYCNGFLQGKTKTTFFGNGKKYSFLNSQIKHINQCTGLKDKNGKLIFECDIVKDDHEALHQVKWSYNCFLLKPCFKNGYTLGLVDDEIEIIGNIYENPELIGGAK